MSNLTDPSIPPFVRPFVVIENRLTYHMGSGQILEGMQLDREGKLDVDGVEHLPLVQFLNYSDEETVGPGGHVWATRGSTNQFDQQTLAVLIIARREFGFWRRDFTLAQKKRGLLEWVGAVRDAVELRSDGTIDALLDGTVSKPVNFRVDLNNISEMSNMARMEIILHTDLFARANRVASSSV